MKFTIVFTLFVWGCVFYSLSANANSVSLSNNVINYEGYTLHGQSVSFTNDMGKYGCELSMQQFDPYSLHNLDGKLTTTNELSLTNISIGLYRNITFNNLYFRPIIGVVHSTINVKTTFEYYDSFRLFDDDYPIDLRYDQYSSKTALLPMYGVSIGYNFNKYFGVFTGYRYQGYDVKSVGMKIEF